MFRIILFLFSIFISGIVSADTYPASGIWYYGGQSFSTLDAACTFAFPGGAYIYQSSTMPSTCNVLYYGSPTTAIINRNPTCPYGGVVSADSCINAPSCTAPAVRNVSTGSCDIPLSLNCVGTQTPLNSNCKYPTDKGNGINCADGTTVYVPMVCPTTGSRWEDIFPPPKHMCSPLDTDHSNCTPSIFQRIDDFASSHAIQYATALLAIAAVPELAVSSEIATILSGVSVEARAVWDGVFHNSAGEIVDVKVAADVPKSVVGDAISDYIKSNPTSPYSSQFPEAYNAQAPHAPIVVDPNTGVIHPVDSAVPLSPNQLADVAKQLSPTLPIPYSDIAPYIIPENIPWLVEAQQAIHHDISNQQAPVNYPELVRTTNPLQSSSPYFQISPNPLQTAPLFPASTPQSITAIQPFTVFRPSSPLPLTPPVSTTTQPPVQYNPNPLGTDAQTSPSIPPPTTPIDPNQVETPPEPPTLYPDTWKYFDFLPMENPFHFDISKLLPTLPQTSCYYEVHTSFDVPFLGVKHVDFAPCLPLQPLRAVLDWVFAVVTVWVCFIVVFRSSV